MVDDARGLYIEVLVERDEPHILAAIPDRVSDIKVVPKRA